MSPETEFAEEVSTALTPDEKRAKRWAETKMDFKWATALLFVLVLALSGMLWNPWSGPTNGTENLTTITELIFSEDGLVAPFEILGVLLLAALIAAGIMGARDLGRAPEDAPWRARSDETPREPPMGTARAAAAAAPATPAPAAPAAAAPVTEPSPERES